MYVEFLAAILLPSECHSYAQRDFSARQANPRHRTFLFWRCSHQIERAIWLASFDGFNGSLADRLRTVLSMFCLGKFGLLIEAT